MRPALRRLTGLLVLAVVLATAVVGGATLVRKRKASLATAPAYAIRPTPVRVATAREGDLLLRRDYLAVIESRQSASVSARIAATVTRVRVDEGDAVAEGDLLVELDGQEIQDEIAALDAQVEQAKAELEANAATVTALDESLRFREREAERDRKLVAEGDIPESSAEESRDRAADVRGSLKAARSRTRALEHGISALARQRDRLETRFGYCRLRAPFAGVVARRLVDPGDLSKPGASLLEIQDRSHVRAAFDVPQSDLRAIREGMPVVLHVNGEDRKAKLDHLFPSLAVDRTLRAEVYLDRDDGPGLEPGAWVPLAVVTERKEGVTLVPASSVVVPDAGKPYVFVVGREESGDRLRGVPVALLGASGDEVAVSGVAPGETVVTSTFLGWARLSEGLPVEAIR